MGSHRQRVLILNNEKYEAILVSVTTIIHGGHARF